MTGLEIRWLDGCALQWLVSSLLIYDFSRDTNANRFVTDIYILMYGVSYSALAWALPSEAFSTGQRSKGVALSTATVWASNFIVVGFKCSNR